MEPWTAIIRKKYQSFLSVVWIPSAAPIAYVGILGDSPVLIKNPGQKLWISPEHNVRSNLQERQKVITRGGVFLDNYVWDETHERGAQFSRALGLRGLNSILDHQPEIFTFSLQSGSIIILATDGVGDPKHQSALMQMERLIEMVEKGAGAEDLVHDAIQRCTNDNATAIVARVNF